MSETPAPYLTPVPPLAQRVREQEARDGSPSRVALAGPTFDGPADAFGFIQFQLGPVTDWGVNGTTIEAVLDVCIRRLQGFQRGPFACRENALAITKLEEAQHWLQHRTAQRVAQGIEGIDVPHTSP